jgi:hypothetical protein
METKQETLLNTDAFSSSCLLNVWHTMKDVLDECNTAVLYWKFAYQIPKNS